MTDRYFHLRTWLQKDNLILDVQNVDCLDITHWQLKGLYIITHTPGMLVHLPGRTSHLLT